MSLQEFLATQLTLGNILSYSLGSVALICVLWWLVVRENGTRIEQVLLLIVGVPLFATTFIPLLAAEDFEIDRMQHGTMLTAGSTLGLIMVIRANGFRRRMKKIGVGRPHDHFSLRLMRFSAFLLPVLTALAFTAIPVANEKSEDVIAAIPGTLTFIVWVCWFQLGYGFMPGPSQSQKDTED